MSIKKDHHKTRFGQDMSESSITDWNTALLGDIEKSRLQERLSKKVILRVGYSSELFFADFWKYSITHRQEYFLARHQ